MSLNLYRLKKSDLEHGTRVLVRAFHDDSLTHFFIPPCDKWDTLATKYYSFRLRFGILFGEVYAPSSQIEGLAAWFSPGKSDMITLRLVRAGGISLSRDVGRESIMRMNMISEYTSRMRKEHVHSPYWHLFPIAVDPDHQGKGYASVLMRPMLSKIAEEGLPCYLETQTEQNKELYEHFGFEVVHEDIIPGLEMKHWGMVKIPK